MRTTTAPVELDPPAIASRLRVGLGTWVALHVEAPQRSTALAGLAAAWEAIAAVDRLMHPHREGSDLRALARCPPGQSVPLHPWTWEVLELSRELHQQSGGAFDPCLSEQPGRMPDIELLAPTEVRPRAAVKVDLGGIAKGFAVDRALQALRACGCTAGLINAGGDLALFGPRAHVIRCVGSADAIEIELHNCALASSDTDAVERPAEHRGYYHGVNRTGAIAGRVSVTAPHAAWADALTKCVLLCERSRLEALLAHYQARIVTHGAASER
jgi:FAD:protein FMN transferase